MLQSPPTHSWSKPKQIEIDKTRMQNKDKLPGEYGWPKTERGEMKKLD